MKSIYISLPITGHEETYESRLNAAVAYVKAKYPEYDRIVTPKEVANRLDDLFEGLGKPNYKVYLFNDIGDILISDAIFMCEGWEYSKGCKAEYAFAKAIGIDIIEEIHEGGIISAEETCNTGTFIVIPKDILKAMKGGE